DHLYRIGVDEISYKRGRRFLTIVADHDTGNVVWVGKQRSKAAFEEFFTALLDDGHPPGSPALRRRPHPTQSGTRLDLPGPPAGFPSSIRAGTSVVLDTDAFPVHPPTAVSYVDGRGSRPWWQACAGLPSGRACRDRRPVRFGPGRPPVQLRPADAAWTADVTHVP